MKSDKSDVARLAKRTLMRNNVPVQQLRRIKEACEHHHLVSLAQSIQREIDKSEGRAKATTFLLSQGLIPGSRIIYHRPGQEKLEATVVSIAPDLYAIRIRRTTSPHYVNDVDPRLLELDKTKEV